MVSQIGVKINGNLPQIGVKTKNVWNHHLDSLFLDWSHVQWSSVTSHHTILYQRLSKTLRHQQMWCLITPSEVQGTSVWINASSKQAIVESFLQKKQKSPPNHSKKTSPWCFLTSSPNHPCFPPPVASPADLVEVLSQKATRSYHKHLAGLEVGWNSAMITRHFLPSWKSKMGVSPIVPKNPDPLPIEE